MRILLAVTVTEQGGAATHIADIVEGLAGRYEFGLATGTRGYLADSLSRKGVPVYYLKHLVRQPSPIDDARAVLEMRRTITAFRPNLVHAHTFKAGLAARIAAGVERVPALYTPHGWPFADGAPLHWKLLGIPIERALARRSHVICVCQHERELADRYRVLRAGDGHVILNGVTDSGLRARPAECAKVLRIVSVGRFARPKRQEDLLRAVSRMRVPVELQLVGAGPRAGFMRELASTLGLSDRVRFLGSADNVAQILAGAHVFALASEWESFPLVVLEAMRAGLPVVASDVGGVKEAVVHGHSGFLVQRGDIGKMQEHLEQLALSPVLREELGLNARRIFEQRFRLCAQLDSLQRLYEKVGLAAGCGTDQPEGRVAAVHGREDALPRIDGHKAS